MKDKIYEVIGGTLLAGLFIVSSPIWVPWFLIEKGWDKIKSSKKNQKA